jgi:hypothetical protein
MWYIIYETTNLVNGKKYRGAHACESLDDGYLGSGYKLKNAIRKYGKSQFAREIIYIAFDYDSLWLAERLLVDEKWIARKDTYNIALGGRAPNRKGIPMSKEAKDKRRVTMAPLYANPAYQNKLSEAQKKRAPPSQETRDKIRRANQGQRRSEEFRIHLSKVMTKLLADPESRQKRSEQSRIANSRPEVRKKISEALSVRKCRDDRRARLREAAKKRCQDPVYLERQSHSQSVRWESNPAKWWNNGTKSVRAVDCPGDEYVPGRLTPGTWWTNGVDSCMAKDCPGPEWRPGRSTVKAPRS